MECVEEFLWHVKFRLNLAEIGHSCKFSLSSPRVPEHRVLLPKAEVMCVPVWSLGLSQSWLYRINSRQFFLMFCLWIYCCLSKITTKHLFCAMLYWSPDATASSTKADHFTFCGTFMSALYRYIVPVLELKESTHFLFAGFVYMHDSYSCLDRDHKAQGKNLHFRYIFLTVDQLHCLFKIFFLFIV